MQESSEKAVPSHQLSHRKFDGFQSFKFLCCMLQIQGFCCIFHVKSKHLILFKLVFLV